MASPFYSPFRRPPMNPFGSMMGFGSGPNLFSGGMPFYSPPPRMPMFGGGLGGFGGFGGFGGYGGGMGGGFNPFGSQFGGMGGGFNPFIMSPPPMQRFPRYDSLIPMQSQMPSQSLQDLPYQPKRPEMTSIEQSPPSVGQTTNLPEAESPVPIEEFNQNFRNIMQTDPMSIQSKEDLDSLNTGPLFANQRANIFEKYSQNPLTQGFEASQSRKIQEDPRIKPIKEFIEEERPPMMEEEIPPFDGIFRGEPVDPEKWAEDVGVPLTPEQKEMINQGGFSIEQPMMPPTPSFTPFDPSGLQARIGDLEGRQMFDPSGLKSRIDALENRQMPAFTSTPFDPSGLQSQISALQNRQMPSYTPFDPTGLQSRLGTLENRQMFDPSGLQSQIDALQNRQMPMFDSSGLQSRLNALEGRVQKTGNLNMTDIEALIEQRLSDSLRNMNPVNQGNQITYDPTLIDKFRREDLRKRYNDRLFIGQGGPGDI